MKEKESERDFGVDWCVEISSDMFSFKLFTGLLKAPSRWDYRECELQAKRWIKRENALRWAVVGNRYYKDSDADVRLRVVAVKCLD